jgi:hypothetical protein
MARQPVCIACGKATGPKAKLNRLPDGRPCPSCAERILDRLPALLPKPSEELDFEAWEEGEPSESSEDDFLEGA